MGRDELKCLCAAMTTRTNLWTGTACSYKKPRRTANAGLQTHGTRNNVCRLSFSNYCNNCATVQEIKVNIPHAADIINIPARPHNICCLPLFLLLPSPPPPRTLMSNKNSTIPQINTKKPTVINKSSSGFIMYVARLLVSVIVSDDAVGNPQSFIRPKALTASDQDKEGCIY